MHTDITILSVIQTWQNVPPWNSNDQTLKFVGIQFTIMPKVSNASFATFQWKETFELWVLSFERTFENVTFQVGLAVINVILMRQTCSQRSSRIAGSKHRALAFGRAASWADAARLSQSARVHMESFNICFFLSVFLGFRRPSLKSLD